MKMWRVLTLTIVLVWIGAPLLDGFMTWLAPAVWTALVAFAPPVATALALVLYFHWRSTLKRRVAGDLTPRSA